MFSLTISLLYLLSACCSASVLSTFRPEKLKISVNKRKCLGDAQKETIELLKNHFIRKHEFNNKDWDRFQSDLILKNNSEEVSWIVTCLLHCLTCSSSYTHFSELPLCIAGYARFV